MGHLLETLHVQYPQEQPVLNSDLGSVALGRFFTSYMLSGDVSAAGLWAAFEEKVSELVENGLQVNCQLP